ncbi:MAG: sensor histidine kinase [Flammeovirgaceae bacterium]
MKLPFLFTTRQKMDEEIARQSMLACEQIAHEMGAELHDDLIQKLTVFSLHIDRLERAAHQPHEVKELLLKMRADFKEMAAAVRRLSQQLMPVPLAGQPFQKSIERLCQSLQLPSQGNVHLTCEGTEQAMPDTTKLYLYRVVQELIHNAFKHSSAWHVWVRLRWLHNALQLEVEDDGTAFSTLEETVAQLGNKYNTLKMRTQAIKASLHYRQGEKGLVALVTTGLLMGKEHGQKPLIVSHSGKE